MHGWIGWHLLKMTHGTLDALLMCLAQAAGELVALLRVAAAYRLPKCLAHGFGALPAENEEDNLLLLTSSHLCRQTMAVGSGGGGSLVRC